MRLSSIELPTIPSLYKAETKDFRQLCKMYGEAFSEDPIWKEILKGKEEKFNVVFGVPVKFALKYGVIYADSPDIHAAATWLPYPYTNMTLWRLFLSGALKEAIKLDYSIGKKISQVFSVIEKDKLQHMKNYSYVYLYVLGVAPSKQGQGHGSTLVKKMIESLSPDIPIYLETETERNVVFYERLGFEVLKKVNVPLLDFPLWEMVNWKRE